MISRRTFVLSGAALMTAAPFSISCPASAQSVGSNDPLAIVNALYTRASTGKGDSGGQFVWLEAKDRPRYLSKSLVALWAKADAHTPKGDEGPPGFDPVTNSQDPEVKSFTVATEARDSGTAVMAVTIKAASPRPHAADETVRYDFVRDGGHWKIDDIRGTIDDKPWSIRALLTDSLKY